MQKRNDGETPCKRIKRGLFRTSKGSLNIMIKVIPNAFSGYGIEACNRPSVLNVYSGVKEFTTLKSFL